MNDHEQAPDLAAQAPLPQAPNVYEHIPSRVAFAPAHGVADRIPFRSRLEARWARYFETMGLPWQYEPFTFFLQTGRRYTPDFRVETPDGLVWVEIKPVLPALQAIEHRLYSFALYLSTHQPGARVVSLTMERPGYWRVPLSVIEWHAEGVTVLEEIDAMRLFASATAREMIDEHPHGITDFMDKRVALSMKPDREATLGEHLFESAVANGADFDAMRVAFLAHDPHSRFTFAQAWKPPVGGAE